MGCFESRPDRTSTLECNEESLGFQNHSVNHILIEFFNLGGNGLLEKTRAVHQLNHLNKEFETAGSVAQQNRDSFLTAFDETETQVNSVALLSVLAFLSNSSHEDKLHALLRIRHPERTHDSKYTKDEISGLFTNLYEYVVEYSCNLLTEVKAKVQTPPPTQPTTEKVVEKPTETKNTEAPKPDNVPPPLENVGKLSDKEREKVDAEVVAIVAKLVAKFPEAVTGKELIEKVIKPAQDANSGLDFLCVKSLRKNLKFSKPIEPVVVPPPPTTEGDKSKTTEVKTK